ncbi:MAG: hypothetical protein ABSH46_21335 [Bryobacteraceae bacterium]|jgi:hypothetical protein
MPTSPDLARTDVQDFAKRLRSEMIPLSARLSYFSTVPLGDDDAREYLHEPVAALPAGLRAELPAISILFVPYLEKGAGGREKVVFEAPAEKSRIWSARLALSGDAVLVFAIKDQQVAEYHYLFYRALAAVAADRLPPERIASFNELLREELRGRVHGELDEEGWKLKQSLFERQSDVRRDTKLFRSYARQSLIDSLTLYLHGICCDIDVETGPRQLPSRSLRRRLELFHEAFPPPDGYAVFPEELKT